MDEGIDEIAMEKDGMPIFIVGPNDDLDKIIATLNRYVGERNYKYISE